ncbi:MAG: stage II sporulation protein R [Desulfitobacterium sp.]|nr:stage II sporulation protein R [Desulfitobacterium sp.]
MKIRDSVKDWIAVLFLGLCLLFFQLEAFHSSFLYARSVEQAKDLANLAENIEEWQDLIRFHVVANSDSPADQALKNLVRDEILKEVSHQLASSQSLDESRQILLELRPTMEEITRRVLGEKGSDYEVRTTYGEESFPTKSYGSLVLPAGQYEAVQVVIGEGKGANWWCVLFPPLCFVDIKHSTAVPVDGKPPVPYSGDIQHGQNSESTQDFENYKNTKNDKSIKHTEEPQKPKVRFWFWEKFIAKKG